MLFADGGRIARVEDKQQSAAWGGGELPTSPRDVDLFEYKRKKIFLDDARFGENGI